MKYVTLKTATNECKVPMIGLGTWQNVDGVEEVVYEALKLGYRHIDTAYHYGNETAIGAAVNRWIREGHGKRSDLFIATKLPAYGNRPEDIEPFVTSSLTNLNTDYLDLYMIHHPFGFKRKPNELKPEMNEEDNSYFIDVATDHVAMWKSLEMEVHKNRVKHLGVSNFTIRQIQKLLDHVTLKPCVVQVELHMYFQQKELCDFCARNGLCVTAYSPLGSPGTKTYYMKKYNYSADKFPNMLENPTIRQVADKHKKQTSEIILSYLTQIGIVVIPKTTNPKRLKLNLNSDIALDSDDIERLRGVDRGDMCRIFDFSVWKGVENHPEYPF